MAATSASKTYNSFVKGLITEAEYLTYPENASTDLSNVDLSKKGNIFRRKGIDYETGYVDSTDTFDESLIGSLATSSYTWKSVGGDAAVNFLVVQIGFTLYFYDMSVSPLSTGKKPFTINLATYQSQADVGNIPVSFTSGRGRLFMSSDRLKPIYVNYAATTNTITTTLIDLEIRDFEGMDDGLAIQDRPATLSNAHKYNLYNAGWWTVVSGADLASYKAWHLVYPSRAEPYLESTGLTSATWNANYHTNYWGNTPAANGHFILDPFYKNRPVLGGFSGSIISTSRRPAAVAFYAGRVWYTGFDGNLYFSQILHDDLSNVGFCYQAADPTSANDSVLVDTDGGVIPLVGAGEFVALIPSANGMIVVAKNGIWAVSGGGGAGFIAGDHAVEKITTEGGLSSSSIVVVDGSPVIWTESGILIVSFDATNQKFTAKDATSDTIKSFYSDISVEAKSTAIGQYDSAAKRIQWLYKDDDADGFNKYNFSHILNFDARIGAWYPYTISKLAANSPYITSAYITPSELTIDSEEVVTDGGVRVTDSGVNVTTIQPTHRTSTSSVQFLTLTPNGAASTFTFSNFSNADFIDWEKEDAVGVSYDSYLETGYELAEEALINKQTPYVVSYCKRTETGFTGDEVTGYSFVNPSSLLMQTKWDWADSTASNNFTTPVQIYKFNRDFTVDPSTMDFDNGFPVVVTKSKVRGRGRAVQFKFSSEEGKDFDLLGWSVQFTATTKV